MASTSVNGKWLQGIFVFSRELKSAQKDLILLEVEYVTQMWVFWAYQ
jgi:hypothetical protein